VASRGRNVAASACVQVAALYCAIITNRLDTRRMDIMMMDIMILTVCDDSGF